jgi:glycosyltransferase involved in cell wall biosynthesis
MKGQNRAERANLPKRLVDVPSPERYDRCASMKRLPHADASALTLSVVIPVWNGRTHLEHCLQALAASIRKPDEIIVVDDGSTDGSAAVARASGAKVVGVAGGPFGPAMARNRGVSASCGAIIVFIDCDVVVHPETLSLMERKFLSNPDVAALFGSYDDRPSEAGLTSGYRNLMHHHVHQQSQHEASTFWSGCGAIRRDAFEAANGFDETYRWASIEDIELGLRLHRGGHRLLLCPEIQGTHRKRWNFWQMIETDVFRRAVPWTKLLLSQGSLPNDLNLRIENRVSAIAAWGLIFLLMFGATNLRALGAAIIPVATLLVCNWSLYRVFYRRRGFLFALGAIGLHWLHYLYSSAAFVIVALESRVRSVAGSARDLRPLIVHD